MKTLIKKEILNELKRLAFQRGMATAEQRMYARVEEETMMEIHPITRPSEEKRFSYLRTLDKYIGKDAAFSMMKARGVA